MRHGIDMRLLKVLALLTVTLRLTPVMAQPADDFFTDAEQLREQLGLPDAVTWGGFFPEPDTLGWWTVLSDDEVIPLLPDMVGKCNG